MASPSEVPEVWKAWRQGYEPTPFFFREVNAHGVVRMVFVTRSLVQLRTLLDRFLSFYPDLVSILLKCRTVGEASAIETWERRYIGKVILSHLQSAMIRHEVFVFKDGYQQLCIRRDDTGEYLALDDHGALYVYSPPEDYSTIARQYGFDDRRDPLLCDEGHWHLESPEHARLLQDFVNDLGLSRCADE